MRTVEEVVRSVEAAAAHTLERDNRTMKVGEVAHQGDVYVIRVEKREDVYAANRLLTPKMTRGEKTARTQVAPGVTPGSRHVVEGERIVIYAPAPGASPLEGPTIEAEGEWALTHPEHAAHRFGPGTFVVTFQQDQATMRRVAD